MVIAAIVTGPRTSSPAQHSLRPMSRRAIHSSFGMWWTRTTRIRASRIVIAARSIVAMHGRSNGRPDYKRKHAKGGAFMFCAVTVVTGHLRKQQHPRDNLFAES